MIKNYIKIAWRNLSKHKGFSIINILGLALGIATCLIIMLYVNHELSFDKYHAHADRIGRVYFQGNIQGEAMSESTVMPPLAQALKTDFSEVEDATRIRDFGYPKIQSNNTVFKGDRFAYVDDNFFSVFSFHFLEGNANTALLQPNSIVITEELAHKYFGNQEAIGKTIQFESDPNAIYTVTGIIENMPENSHFRFSLLASMNGVAEAKEANWMVSNFYTYFLLKDGYNFKAFEKKLDQLVATYIGPQMLPNMGVTYEDFKNSGNSLSFHVQPLTEIHFQKDVSSDLSAPGEIRYVYIFSAIAVFMLLIACINFMNLSTASSFRRAKEVGVRKVVGSTKNKLIAQFLVESTLISSLAFLLSLGLIYLALPIFNSLTNIQLSLSYKQLPYAIPLVFSFVVFVGLLAGSFPAFFISSLKPIQVLKGKLIQSKSIAAIKNGLVVFQFSISIILMISTFVVYKQLSYIQNKDIGYEKDQVLLISDTWQLGDNRNAFRQELQNDPRIEIMSSSEFLPAGPSSNNNFFVSSENDPEKLIKTLRYEVDENYIPLLAIELASGRNFSRDYATDSSAVILNEVAVKALGFNENALDKTIYHADKKGVKKPYHVLAVVKDFHFKSLHEKISPLVMVYAPNNWGTFLVKTMSENQASLIASLQKSWASYNTEEPLNYSFLDDRYNQTYQSEMNTGKLLGIFSSLNIFVACLGLFGLATFTVRQRLKEVGIRKVFGASSASLVSLLAKDFIKLVLIALLIASPIAYVMMNKWLADFAYRIDIQWYVFVLIGILAIFIAAITISLQTIKVVAANPVDSLRDE
ncbi:ABC transporter permease [Sphingobacterium hungaricum]|uniref:Cell division protein FtsX n=1 Tax=Sphingobacterium hungaricum TaxID=2082723 RepID=A0A928V3Q5_9SPHI|nr:ABC transporter permease [Sphingobacterium hungaricum]MBE8715564.1 cell division protein FtsX [Sphingobacterium hungaricum]